MTEPIRIIDPDHTAYETLLRDREPGLNIVDSDDARIVLGRPDLVAAALDRGMQPKWIQSTWAGVAPLVAPARAIGATVTGLKGVFGPLIAEYVFAILLADVRKAQMYRDAQRSRTWTAAWPDTLRNRRITIIGAGSVGSAIATTARHLRMTSCGVSRRGLPNDAFDTIHAFESLTNALAGANYVVACLPETAATRNLIDARAFEAMARGATFINVGRASTVDHDALVQALADKLEAAHLDVFDEEPLPPDSPLWTTENLSVTPHVAGVSYPSDVVEVFVGNLVRLRHGAALDGVVDLTQGY